MFTEKEIADIAGSLEAGFNCYVHRISKEVIEIPELSEDSDRQEFWSEYMDKVEKDKDSYLEIPKMDSRKSFRLMENFVNTVSDEQLRQKLLRALTERKPFRSFRYQIDNAGGYRERWFTFKTQQLTEWVKDVLEANELYVRPEEDSAALESKPESTGLGTSIIAEEVEEMESKLLEAVRQSDVEWLDSFIHNKLLAIAPDGKIITKEMDLASHMAGEMIVNELQASIENINIIDNSAVVCVVYNTRGKMLGQPIAGQFRYLRVWKKFDDGLKVIAASCFKLSS